MTVNTLVSLAEPFALATFASTDGNDVIDGDGEANTFIGSRGADVYDGFGGVDTIDYSGLGVGVTLRQGGVVGKGGGFGRDTFSDVEHIIGAEGQLNEIDFLQVPGGQTSIIADLDTGVLTIRGGAGVAPAFLSVTNFKDVRGTVNSDQLFGDEQGNRLRGEAGDDGLYGRSGNDTMGGSFGNDTVDGGTGNDRVFGNEGNDLVVGGDGNDFTCGGVGNDTVGAGNGNDTLRGLDGNDRMFGNAGSDIVQGGNGDDFTCGGLGNDTITPGFGRNTARSFGGDDIFQLSFDSLVDTILDIAVGDRVVLFEGFGALNNTSIDAVDFGRNGQVTRNGAVVSWSTDDPDNNTDVFFNGVQFAILNGADLLA